MEAKELYLGKLKPPTCILLNLLLWLPCGRAIHLNILFNIDYYEKWLRIIQEEQKLKELPFIEIGEDLGEEDELEDEEFLGPIRPLVDKL